VIEARQLTCEIGVMGKIKWLITIVVSITVVSTIWLQHEQNRELVQELEHVRQEKATLEPPQVPPNPEQAQSEIKPKKVEEMESELMRLRGAASLATRVEAENTQLRQEVERLRVQVNGSAGSASQNSDALSGYLGPTVETPANLDPAYTKDGLSAAIQLAAQKAGISLKKVGIDDSEFPFLIGVNSQPGDWEKLKAQLNGLDGYEYHGSVGDDTSHAFSIIPTRAYPAGAVQHVMRRLNVRTQQYYDSFTAQQN